MGPAISRARKRNPKGSCRASSKRRRRPRCRGSSLRTCFSPKRAKAAQARPPARDPQRPGAFFVFQPWTSLRPNKATLPPPERPSRTDSRPWGRRGSRRGLRSGADPFGTWRPRRPPLNALGARRRTTDSQMQMQDLKNVAARRLDPLRGERSIPRVIALKLRDWGDCAHEPSLATNRRPNQTFS